MSRRPATDRPRRPHPLRAPTRAWGCALIASLSVGLAQARCLDEDQLPTLPAGEPVLPGAAPQADPRSTLQALVREALARSQAVGAAALIAQATLQDVEEVRAGKALQAGVGGGIGPGGSRAAGVTENAAAQLRASFNISQLLYDGGRTDRLTDWKTQLAESARYGHLSQQEQLALTTVALSLERSRFRSQVQIYRNYVRKMGCLVESLDSIVKTDRGRASELVQAKKSLEQAELSQTQTQSVVRQYEIRLRRLVGDGLPPVEGLATLFTIVPPQEQLIADVERAYDIAQLDAQAAAAGRYVEAVAAGNRPQLSLAVNGGLAAGLGGNANNTRSGVYSVGVLLNVPILAPGIAPATEAARKRAQAALLQRADAVEARRYRVAEVYEQSQASLDRARRLAVVLRDSEQVRNFTLQQWQNLGRRSLFDVMSAEGEHYNLRVAYVNALHDVQQLNANLLSLGRGVNEWLQ